MISTVAERWGSAGASGRLISDLGRPQPGCALQVSSSSTLTLAHSQGNGRGARGERKQADVLRSRIRSGTSSL